LTEVTPHTNDITQNVIQLFTHHSNPSPSFVIAMNIYSPI